MITDKSTYIGDGIYAEIENGQVKLMTQRGYDEWHFIFLDGNCIQSLVNFANANQDQIQ